jgi:N-acyl-phosphatidylethanolamine-hydrolysing phospholipase D
MLPIHFDTFFNSLDEQGEAPHELRTLLPHFGLDEQRVPILAHGEQHVFVSAVAPRSLPTSLP